MRQRILLALVALVSTSGLLSTAPAQALGKVKYDENSNPGCGRRYDPIVNRRRSVPSRAPVFATPRRARSPSPTRPTTRTSRVRQTTAAECSACRRRRLRRLLECRASLPLRAQAGQLVPAQQLTAYCRGFDHKDFGQGKACPRRPLVATGTTGAATSSSVPIGPSIPWSSAGRQAPPHAHCPRRLPVLLDGVLPTHK